jgi:hypothetical protein
MEIITNIILTGLIKKNISNMNLKYIAYGFVAFIAVIATNVVAIKRDNEDKNIRRMSEKLIVMTEKIDEQEYLKISKQIRNQQTENFE